MGRGRCGVERFMGGFYREVPLGPKHQGIAFWWCRQVSGN